MQEPYGAYSWYAVNDQPSDKAFYDFTLRAPAPMVGVANGEMASHERWRTATSTTSWHLDSKTSSYLVTVAFGDYKVTEDESSSGVPISYWVPTSSRQYLDELRYLRRPSSGSRASSAPTPGRRSASCSSTRRAGWRPRR